MTDTRAQTFAEWWNGSDASGRGRLAASDGSFYGIAQDAWLAAWSARDGEIAAKDADYQLALRVAAEFREAAHELEDERDEALSSLAAKDAEIERLNDEHSNCWEMGENNKRLRVSLSEAQKRIEELRKHAGHGTDCDSIYCGLCQWAVDRTRTRHTKIGFGEHAIERRPCTCGLTALLSTEGEKKP
jgi:hypothetical protein